MNKQQWEAHSWPRLDAVVGALTRGQAQLAADFISTVAADIGREPGQVEGKWPQVAHFYRKKYAKEDPMPFKKSQIVTLGRFIDFAEQWKGLAPRITELEAAETTAR